MFLDARQIERDTDLDTDLCIVGGGAAGITLARRFMGGQTRVCLIESGGLSFDAATQTLYQGENVGIDYYPLDVCRLRFFGGSTNAWGGWCRPLDEIDFESRPWIAGSGWPFGYDSLEKYYAEAHKICQIDNPQYDASDHLENIGDKYTSILPIDPGQFETTVYTFSPPTRFGRTYAEEIRRSSNITCLLHANVTNIDTTDDVGAVTGVRISCIGGNKFTVRAKTFVLAAGGVENARLLLLSNDKRAAGLGNDHDLVGRYFMEHPQTERRLVSVRPDAPLDFYGLNYVQSSISARLSLTPGIQRQNELLQYSANIKPVYVGEDSAGWMSFKKLYEWLHPKWSIDPISRFPPYEPKGFRLEHPINMTRDAIKLSKAVLGNALKPKQLISHFVLQSKSEQEPNPDSRIRLTTQRDLLGQNRVELDWRMSSLDRRTMCVAEDILDEEFKRLDIGRLDDRGDGEEEAWPSSLHGGWHQLGTTRMHDDPKRGVVDANSQVHGLSNLFVAGGSVFPTSGVTTPTLTIVALAVRLADHLQSTAFAA